MQPLISVKSLTKSYEDKQVVHGIDLDLHAGEVLSLLGPNGAGKSTTINIITGALAADGGSIEHQGRSIYADLKSFKACLGIVPQDLALYEDLTALANVRFFASLYGLRGNALTEGCDFALRFCGLADQASEKVASFSGGMKRRLNIACAIAHHPQILIMDEPTVGIDPQSRNHILEGVTALSGQGVAILYTTHYMEEAEAISSRIIILDEGLVIAEGSLESLQAAYGSERVYRISAEGAEGLDTQALTGLAGVTRVAVGSAGIEVACDQAHDILDQVISALAAQGLRISDISCQSASLETMFLSLTGKSLRD
jgi:ABC-2 type transport system ATP-binding protein